AGPSPECVPPHLCPGRPRPGVLAVHHLVRPRSRWRHSGDLTPVLSLRPADAHGPGRPAVRRLAQTPPLRPPSTPREGVRPPEPRLPSGAGTAGPGRLTRPAPEDGHCRTGPRRAADRSGRADDPRRRARPERLVRGRASGLVVRPTADRHGPLLRPAGERR